MVRGKEGYRVWLLHKGLDMLAYESVLCVLRPYFDACGIVLLKV